MSRILRNLLLIILLFFILSMERVFGLPILFVAGLLILYSKVEARYQLFLSIFFGVALAVFYSFSLWIGVLLIGILLLNFESFKRYLTSNSLRLLISVLLTNLSIYFLTTPTLSWAWGIYHLASFCIVIIILLFMIGINLSGSSLRISRRFDR